MIVKRFEVRRGIVGRDVIDAVLRVMWNDLWRHTLTAVRDNDAHWFPQLRFRPEVAALREGLPPEWQTGVCCEPQILWQMPHRMSDPIPPITYHTDKEPPWAKGRRYARIVAIPLTPWNWDNGGLIVKLKGQDDPYCPHLQPSDAFCMAPDVEHSGGINLTGMPRIGVYFRWLKDQESP